MKKELILIKLGGSVITDVNKPNTARFANLRRLIKEIKSAGKGKTIIVGHGAGSFAHVPAHKYKVNAGLINKKSKIGTSITQMAATRLHQIIVNEMVKAGIAVFSFSPSSSIITSGKKIVNWDVKPIRDAISKGFVPVVYGDVALDNKQGVCIASTEEVFRYLSFELKPDKVIIGSDVDGVFTDDPKEVRDAKLIKEIREKDLSKIVFDTKSSRKFNVTGSMKSKVELLYEMSSLSSGTCQIINANVPGRLRDSILGKRTVSTVIKA